MEFKEILPSFNDDHNLVFPVQMAKNAIFKTVIENVNLYFSVKHLLIASVQVFEGE